MGMSLSGGSKIGEQRLAVFFDSLASKGIDVKDLPARIRNPIDREHIAVQRSTSN